jgi:hypothetical protein
VPASSTPRPSRAPAAVTHSRARTPLPTPAPTGTRAAPEVVTGGRVLPEPSTAHAAGVGFDSPLGRFAVTESGILIGGSADGTASVSLVAPSGLVALAALLGLAAVLGQRRAERRRRLAE